MSQDRVNLIADMWAAGIKATVAAAEKVPEEKRMKQLQDGKSHPTWLVAHRTFAARFPCLAPAVPGPAGDQGGPARQMHQVL